MWYTNPMAEIQFVDGGGEKKRTWVQLLRPGEWKHSEYGKLSFDDKFFDSMIRNFDNDVRRIELAIDAEHKPEEGAAGWIKKLENRGKEGLWALVEWTNKGTEYLKDKIYRYLSAEFDHSWKDEETGRKYKNVLFGAALTNRPFIKGMEPINLSEYKKELKDDDEIKKLVALAERITKILGDGDNVMKKCKKCEKEKELNDSGLCSVCLKENEQDEEEKKKEEEKRKKKETEAAAIKQTEEGETAKIKQTPSGSAPKSDDHDQAKKREEAEKKKNKGNVVAKGPKSVKQVEGKDGVVVFEDESGNLYFLDEDEDEDDEKKKKKKKEDDEVELSEGVTIATKKFSEREKATLVALSEADGKTREVLSENLKVLKEGRVESENRNLKEMLNEHFMDGKLTPNEKTMWEEILSNETPQTDVAVFKLSEGEGDAKKEHFRPLIYIVDKMLSERPAVVELKEMARSDSDSVRLSEEQKEQSDASNIGKRVAGRINPSPATQKRLDEDKK